jgi:hypothetical protein
MLYIYTYGTEAVGANPPCPGYSLKMMKSREYIYKCKSADVSCTSPAP